MEMTNRVILALVVDMPDEQVLVQVELDTYSADLIDLNIEKIFEMALKKLSFLELSDLQKINPELTVYLESDEERAALHLTSKSIHLLSLAGCSFDFDPYCTQDNPEFWITGN